ERGVIHEPAAVAWVEPALSTHPPRPPRAHHRAPTPRVLRDGTRASRSCLLRTNGGWLEGAQEIGRAISVRPERARATDRSAAEGPAATALRQSFAALGTKGGRCSVVRPQAPHAHER